MRALAANQAADTHERGCRDCDGGTEMMRREGVYMLICVYVTEYNV
jgi:hypothetical protein